MDSLVVARDLLVRCQADVLVNWRESDGGLSTTLVCHLPDGEEAEQISRRLDLASGEGLVGRLLGAARTAGGRDALCSAVDPEEVVHDKFVASLSLQHVILLPCEPLGQLLGCTGLYFSGVPPEFNHERAFAASDLLTLLKREQYGSQRRSSLMAVAQSAANTYHDISQEAFLARSTIQRRFGANPDSWPPGLAAVEAKLRSIDRMTEELNGLLKEGLEPSMSKIYVPTVLEAVAASFKERFSATGTSVTVEHLGRPRCRANRSLLTRALSNLLDNALTSIVDKYSRGGGAVALRAAEQDECVVIQVEDNGRGVDPVRAGAIWNLGYTTKTDARRSQWGLGLGQVLSFAESMGGTAEVASTWGDGATFTIRIPKGSD